MLLTALALKLRCSFVCCVLAQTVAKAPEKATALCVGKKSLQFQGLGFLDAALDPTVESYGPTNKELGGCEANTNATIRKKGPQAFAKRSRSVLECRWSVGPCLDPPGSRSL